MLSVETQNAGCKMKELLETCSTHGAISWAVAKGAMKIGEIWVLLMFKAVELCLVIGWLALADLFFLCYLEASLLKISYFCLEFSQINEQNRRKLTLSVDYRKALREVYH